MEETLLITHAGPLKAFRTFLFKPVTPEASPLSCHAFTIAVCIAYSAVYQACRSFYLLEPKGLKQSQRIHWYNGIMGDISAFTVLAIISPAIPESQYYKDKDCYYGYAVWQDLGARCFVGYLIHDTVTLLRYKELWDLPMIFHHLLFMAVGYYSAMYSYLKFPCLWLVSGEFSNFFMNTRTHMAILGYKGFWYSVNGITFLVTFGLTRVILYGKGLWHLIRTKYMWLSPEAPQAFVWIIGLLFVAYILQLYWFVMIAKAVSRAVKRLKSGQQDQHEHID